MMSEAPLNWIVVEDNPDSRFLFERFIRKVAGEEVNVVSLSSVEDCRAYAKLSDEPADALVLDLMLPDGTGRDAVDCLGSLVERARIMVCSALDPDKAADFVPDPPYWLLPKPVSLDAFSQTVEEIA